MYRAYFEELTARLADTGIAAQHVQRTVEELRDHVDDLENAAIEGGANRHQAAAIAIQQLGPIDEFVNDMASRRELKSWAFRYPRAAVVYYPVACVAMLPAYPFLAGIAHGSSVVRWGASLLVAGVFTGFMLLVMQLSIFLG